MTLLLTPPQRTRKVISFDAFHAHSHHVISQVCVLAVPKHVALMAGDDEATHLRAVGYRVVSDEGEPVQLEGTDDFVTRMQVATRLAPRP